VIEVPAGYRVRAPEEAELAATVEIMRASEEIEYGEAETSLDDVRGYVASVDLRSGAWLVVDAEDRAVAFGSLRPPRAARFFGFGLVHPEHERQGLGRFLVGKLELEARARLEEVPPGPGVFVSTGASNRNARARQLFEQAGFRQVRRFWDMTVNLDHPPAPPRWPTGVTVSTVGPDQQRALHEAIEEAFQDHWNSAPSSFEEWERRRLAQEFDSGLWFVASEGDEIAGAALCRQREAGGWVDVLGVRRPWRRRGLGEALLRHSFGEFFRRGVQVVGLGVDSENLTGATRLYERAGMRVAKAFDSFEKELRPPAGAIEV
jgi:mycothiol synthase